MLVERYFRGNLGVSGATTRYTNSDILELLAKYPEIRASASRHYLKSKLLPPAAAVSLHYLFGLKDPVLAEQFMRDIVTGSNLAQGSPVYLLRERLVRNATDKAKLGREYMLALAIKAWNATRSGRTLRALKFTDGNDIKEAFPVIL